MNYDSRGNRGSSGNVSGMRCSFCHSPTHKVADCYRRKNQERTTEKQERSKDKPPVETKSVTLIAREVLPVEGGSLGKGGTNIKSRDTELEIFVDHISTGKLKDGLGKVKPIKILRDTGVRSL